jgi:hypothetical protein
MPRKVRSSSRKTRAGARNTSPAAAKPATAAVDGTRQQRILLPATTRVARAVIDFGRVLDKFLPKPRQTFRIQVRRPADLLVFDVIFNNLKLTPGASPRLERTDAAAYLTIEFPPQSFGEEAFLEAATANADGKPKLEHDPGFPLIPALPPLPTSRIRMAGPSRIVLSMPNDQSTLPYGLTGVLTALRTWPMRLDVNAIPDPKLAIIGRDWLNIVAASTNWKAIAGSLSAAVAAANPGMEQILAQSARNIAERAAAGLNSATHEDLQSVLQRQMQTEIDRVAARFPDVREGGGRDAGMALLALQTAEQLAKSRTDFAFGVVNLSALPFLSILFAPHQPARSVTALELPYRLMLSPVGATRWQHQDAAVERRGRTELWHTRLRTTAGEFGGDGESRVRALWSRDYGNHPDPFKFIPAPAPPNMSLDPQDRDMLVRLMAGFDEKPRIDGRNKNQPYTPRSSEAKRLHLSALGALFDAEGNWDLRPLTADIQQWRHLAALGRDHYVRVMYAGYLCPFGHAASLIKITERKFQAVSGNDPKKRIAVLRQRFFVVVREHVKDYSGSEHKYAGNNFPFKRVEILTRITPDLYQPGASPSDLKYVPGFPPAGQIYVAGVTPRMVFWPMVPAATNPPGATDFLFDIATTDRAGNRVTFAMPLLFISEIPNGKADRLGAIKTAYNASAVAPRRRAEVGGATVAYSDFDAGDKGDPRLPTRSMTFAAGDLTVPPHQTAPNFYPEMEGAEVGIRSVQKMLGLANFVQPVAYPDVFKQHAFDAGLNPGQIFLQLTQVANLNFGGQSGQAKSDALGALASPQMAILGLSKIAGPVSGAPPTNPSDPGQIATALGKVIGNTFDPAEFFQGAKILGGISLSDILAVAHSLAGEDVPKMLSRDLGDRIEASFNWKTAIAKPDPLNLIIPRADNAKPETTLEMRGLVTTPVKSPADADFSATATINNFKVNLFGFIIIWFELLSFAAKKGQKPDVQVTLREGEDAVQFGGPLEFVNTLRQYIPANGFSDPPSLSVTPSGISAGYSLTLPAIGVGIFSLSNASLGAAFNLPFDSKPSSVKFNFSEREHPFSLTVSLLGGGGFFAIGVSSRGVTEIEAALEFGAALSIDLGVASGSVEVKAGVYFHWLEPIPDKGSIDLAGYVRIHGELTVIAIISVSLTFNLQLGYHKDSAAHTSTMYGEATLVVEVDVLFISVDVSVSCRREFGGSASDPKFIDLMPSAQLWTEYCGAFAAEGP